MAEKEIKKTVQKGSTGKKRRLKRSVRKSLGALSLAAAIAVAAIPVENLEAQPTTASDTDWGTLEKNMPGASGIPDVKSDDKIYTTGDGIFQFAYVAPDGGSGNKVAVILGYDKDGSLPNGALTIPNTVDAYARLSDNLGTGNGYTAIGKSGDFLYYKVEEQESVSDGNVQTITHYEPCYYETKNKWQYADGSSDTERPLESFYYYPGNTVTPDKDPLPTTSPDNQWIKDIAVRYIGNQYLESDGKGGWKVAGSVTYSNRETKGIFANAGNIQTLTVGSDMSGIGDYAFYGCTNLSSITLNNGLNTIGVGAFANCINMSRANIDIHSMVSVIGDYAFYYCRALMNFALPNQVSRIGNSAFENCEALQSFTMGMVNPDGSQENGLLSSLGSHVFKNCKSLKNISFRSQFNENVPLSTFEGCSALEYIEVANSTIDFTEDGNYKFENFKADVLPTFYFKGIKDSTLHKTATEHEVAFSYFDSALQKDVYELTVDGIVYRVDDSDNLVYCDTTDHLNFPETVSLPDNIGPNHIRVIDTSTFQNRCELTMITIPSSITEIKAEAFKGCHQLKWVIFKDPNSGLIIGQHAFQTQETTCIKPDHQSALKEQPELNFVGPISYASAPFNYAMTSGETIDNGSQPTTYIKYYSGWPSHLAVVYNPEKDENELVDYPTLSGLVNYSTAKYKYLTSDQASAMASALQKYKENPSEAGSQVLSTDEQAAIDAALHLVLPEGIEGFKDGLFVEKEGAAGEEKTEGDKTITAASLRNIDDEAFKGHKNLVQVTLTDVTQSIGDHAFEDCEKLTSVNLPGTVSSMGIRPFAGCSELSSVNFGGGPFFTCDNSIIYELDSSGAKNKLVECLEGRRSTVITSDETEGITELYPEAFMETGVLSVDMGNSRINVVPQSAFANTDHLAIVVLPRTMNAGRIESGAFANSAIESLTIPGEYINVTEGAFSDAEGANVAPHFADKSMIVICEENSMADQFAKEHKLQSSYQAPEIYYNVRFFYYDDDNAAHQIGDTQEIQFGQSAKAPELPGEALKEGYTFTGWLPDTWQAVTGNVDTYAQFVKDDAIQYTVIFMDDDGQEISRQTVNKGNSAVIPQNPVRAGYVFLGWKLVGGTGDYVTSLSNIQADMTLIAQYRLADGGSGSGTSPGPGASGSPNPGASGSPNPGGSASPSPGTNGSASPSPGTNSSASPSPGAAGTFYTLTVQNGSGSGSYLEGSQPVIIANDPASGQEFDYWSVSPEDVKIASKVLSASIVTMPAKDVTVTAHYKAKTGSSGGGSTGSGNSSKRPNGTSGVVSRGGTTVVIDKNGLSNTGVVSATVNGSSDNFTVKISESAEATEAALRALMAEYGDNLDNIKFFPMDISLYDSTGTTKITDTTGLSVSITLPLPDSLITYAGNNKVASVVNDRLERLSARFTTIQGVSCITFTAEHFSPYVIYVNTGDLSSGLVSDETPKTGDFIHPKWFLSIALACLSFVLFMQRDTKKPKKVKAKVRA